MAAISLRRRDAFRTKMLNDLPRKSLEPSQTSSIEFSPILPEEDTEYHGDENTNPQHKKNTNRAQRIHRKAVGLGDTCQLTPHPFRKNACDVNNNTNSCRCQYLQNNNNHNRTPELLETSCNVTFNDTMETNYPENDDSCFEEEGSVSDGTPDKPLCVCYKQWPPLSPCPANTGTTIEGSEQPGDKFETCSSETSTSGTWAGEEFLLADFEEFAVSPSSLKTIQSQEEEIPAGIRDIDEITSADSHLNCSDSAKDIIKYLQQLEQRHKITEMCVIGETTHGMRGLLVDWLIQVQNHLYMEPDVLWLTMSLLNTYLCKYPVHLVNLQLVGITCLLIAKKYEDAMDTSEISNLIHLTDNSYRTDEVLEMELEILNKLNFDLSLATPFQFLKRFLMALPDHDISLDHLTCYLMELCLTDMKCITFLPSQYAAACLYLAYHLLDETADWGPDIIYYTGYTEPELFCCLERIATNVVKAEKSKFQGAKTKYASVSRYGAVSSLSVLKNSLLCKRLSHRSVS